MRYYPKLMASAILQGIYNVGMSLNPSLAELCVGHASASVTFFFYHEDRTALFEQVLGAMMVDGMSSHRRFIEQTDSYTLTYELSVSNAK